MNPWTRGFLMGIVVLVVFSLLFLALAGCGGIPIAGIQSKSVGGLWRQYDATTGVLCYYISSGVSCLPRGSFTIPDGGF